MDWMPFGGSYVGTVVKENHLIAQNSMIKVGIAIGGMVRESRSICIYARR